MAHFVIDYKVFRGTEALTLGRNTYALLGLDRFLSDILVLGMKFYWTIYVLATHTAKWALTATQMVLEATKRCWTTVL